ncbi:hypothetical protein PR202_ga04690 [Eleusine coracana subsp. coracana]|uniref:Uncharacterized protein n=1 Tax=Eleusine coracana subsp. coracana TaxID=191504 RepID=A0AAV5BR07_ELECO|nr:hypothetical protein PR202_ga04690 [Eleusine coracana subsp. coracana]
MLRRKIREMMDRVPETAELTDPEERKAKMRELMTKYELVVEEEDPNWPEDNEDGMGFSLGQFFDNITIKAEKKDENDDEADDGKEIVWEDDNYIKPIRDVRTKDWDASVFTDFGPMIVLVHNRYKRPKENETARDELVKAIEMFWEHNLPSPRCVAVDACAEPDLVEALKVSGFPEILFTNAGRIIHRDKVVRSADEWSRMMAFFYYKAARPPFLSEADGQAMIALFFAWVKLSGSMEFRGERRVISVFECQHRHRITGALKELHPCTFKEQLMSIFFRDCQSAVEDHMTR